jgi:hypothetical protein
MAEPPLLCERDTVNADGSFNRRAILAIAQLRAAAERDLDVLVAAYGPCLQLPAGISQHNVVAWRRTRAARVDRRGLRLTPFRKLLADEMRRAWSAARAVRGAKLRERAALAAQAARESAEPLPATLAPEAA